MTASLTLRLCATTAILALAGCEQLPSFGFMTPGTGGAEVTRAAQSTTLVERDVEAPEVFQVTEAGLWDGRPSLGGVWVAHPDVTEPERVIIRNEVSGKFVIGALFRKERETTGPKLQVSSDAAQALELPAGATVSLNVTALRREAVPDVVADAPANALPAAAAIEAAPLDADPAIQAASAALEATAPAPQPIPDVAAPAPQPLPVAARTTPTPQQSALAKPFIQIGIFSVEGNARRTADMMRSAGIVPSVFDQESKGKRFWRVIVGPFETKSDRAEVLKTVTSLGFSDAYFVTN